ncbi:MAG TPA: C4-dicarboxylate transporter DcuC [Sutterellaceae bacterium]|nr:C4-dicarboxylate transporter DcuC [Sutterellaceae bacterium]
MTVTAYIALAVLAIMIYLIIKQYETRLVLLGGGLILCLISLQPMQGLHSFATNMVNGSLITAICSAQGFAYTASYTNCDRSLVYYLSRPIRNLGLFLIPLCAIITFFINIAIPSAVGVGAVVGSTLIPLMLRAGIKPAAAAAAVLSGTMGSLLSPGLSHNAYVSEMAGMGIMDLISYHSVYSFMIGGVAAVGVFLVCMFLGDHKGEKVDVNNTDDGFVPSPIRALVPLVPIVLMLVCTVWFPELKMGVTEAMLLGTIACLIVAHPDAQIFSKKFFQGMGDSYGEIMGIIISAGVLAAGLMASGLIDALIKVMVASSDVARWGGSFGPFLLSIIMGSGDAGAMAFNGTVTPHASEFGMSIEGLGSLAFLAGACGRTASPIAGITILLAGLAHANPFDVVKRTIAPMFVATFLLAIFMV